MVWVGAEIIAAPVVSTMIRSATSDVGRSWVIAMATIVICLRPGAGAPRRVGMVVRRVLDVSPGTLLPEDPELCSAQIAMVKDRVTTMHRVIAAHPGPPTMAILLEVA